MNSECNDETKGNTVDIFLTSSEITGCPLYDLISLGRFFNYSYKILLDSNNESALILLHDYPYQSLY